MSSEWSKLIRLLFRDTALKLLLSKVNEEIPLWATTQQGVTEKLEVVLPATNERTNQ